MASKFGLSKLLVILIVVVIVLGSIGVGYFALTQLAAPPASPTPTPTPSPSPTPSPTAVPTPTPTPTSTPSPSPPPSPTATPTPTPPPTLTPTLAWNKTYGGTTYDCGLSVVQTSDGGYVIACETLSFGAGGYEAWLVKTDAAGNMLWNQTYGGAGGDGATSVVETSDGGYAITGGTTTFGAGNLDVWLIKTDASGNAMWNQTYGGTDNEYGYSIVQTSDGGYAITGGTESFGAGNDDVWLIKTDASGNAMWNQTYGGPDDDYGYSVVQAGDGGYVIAGYTYSFGAGSSDAWLVRTDASGNELWNQTYGGTEGDNVCSVVQTGDGGFATAGYTLSLGAGSIDFWLVRTDASGNELWNQTYGGTESDRAWSMVATGDGGFAIAGYTYSFGAGGFDAWLVRTDASGNELWNQTYGGTEGDRAWSLVGTSDGGYAMVGSTYSFGAGERDVWLLKIDVET